MRISDWSSDVCSSDLADAWTRQHGGIAAATPGEAAKDADVVLSCVGNDDDLAQVTLGRDGAFKALKAGALFVDHTPVSARIARQLSVEAASSEERRGGKECVSTCRSRWSPDQ